jgi:hypothetical protein
MLVLDLHLADRRVILVHKVHRVSRMDPRVLKEQQVVRAHKELQAHKEYKV